MKGAEDRSCVRKFRSRYNGTSKAVLNALKTIELTARKGRVERIAVIKFRMNERSSDSAGSFVIKRRANTTKVANVEKAAFRQGGNLIRKGEVFIKDKAKIASRD